MRVLLRDVRTGEYCDGAGKWTRDVGLAYDFRNTWQAIELSTMCGRHPVEIVLSFEDPWYDIAIPVAKVRGQGAERKREHGGDG